MQKTFILDNEEQTKSFAERLAPCLRLGDVVLLYGDLGVGKTTFVRYILLALGYEREAPSPTFTLIQSYEVQIGDVFHFDLYRLKSPEEIEETGFDEACADGLVFVEWPDKAASYMPRGTLSLQFGMEAEEGRRSVTLVCDELWDQRLKDFGNAD